MAMADGDRNLLFGVLALQMDFLNRDGLVKATQAWAGEKAKSLSQILVEHGALSEALRILLEPLVDEHVRQHGGAEKSLAAVSPVFSAHPTLQQTASSDVGFGRRAPQIEGFIHTLKQILDPDAPSNLGAGTLAQPSVGAASAVGLRFRILRPHAEGGLGKVSVARDEELHREVALKEIKERHVDDQQSRARFLVEAEITGALEHPGVVPVYGLGQYEDGRPFYAMRFIKGDTLRNVVERFHKADAAGRPAGERALELRKLLGRFVGVCEAVAYAHSRGILHRDLKPDNIMLGKYGETLVVDWGLAKPVGVMADATDKTESLFQPASGSAAGVTQPGSAVGTPQFMPPEQAEGRLDELGPASDVYSLGATLYSLLTGKSPFSEPTVGEVLQKVQRGEFPPPRLVNAKVPPALEAVCLKAMALRPEDRYPTSHALAEEIEKWLGDEPVSAWREPWRTRAGRWARRHQTLAGATAAGLLVALLAGGAGALWYQQDRAARATEQATRASGTASGVSAALDEAATLKKQAATLKDDPLRWKETLSEAISAVKRAEGLLNSGEGTDDLRNRVAVLRGELEAAEKDRRMVAQLEEVRLQSAVTNKEQESDFDFAREALRYKAAFEEDMRLSTLSMGEAAECINNRKIRDDLLAALADWSIVTTNIEEQERLRELLTAADPDAAAFRNRWNAAVARKSLNALQHLAFSSEANDQPVARVALMGGQLAQISGADAAAFLKEANERHPGDFWILYKLANACSQLKPPMTDDAVRYFTAALALRPGSSTAHVVLGNALWKKHQLDDALMEYHTAIRLMPNNALAYNGIGVVLDEKGKWEEAAVEYRKAIELNPQSGMLHCNFGRCLHLQGKLDEATAEYHRAIELYPKYAIGHYNFGHLLQDQGNWEEATAEYRKAIKLDPKYVNVHVALAKALLQQSEFAEASIQYRLALDLLDTLPATDALRKSIPRNLRHCEDMLALEKKLPDVLKGESQPADADEQVSFGHICYLKKRYADSVRFYANAFAAQPTLADDLPSANRYVAARAAVLASAGQGEDADKLDDKERAHLRQEALGWLRANLAERGNLIENGTPRVRANMQKSLRHWRENPDLASVHDAAALDKLPEAERAEWKKLWADVEELVKKDGERRKN